MKANWDTCVNGTDSSKCPTAGSLEGITTFQVHVPLVEYRILYGPQIVTDKDTLGSPSIRNEQGDKWHFDSEVDQEGSGYFYVDYNCSNTGISIFFVMVLRILTDERFRNYESVNVLCDRKVN